jgi:hypothetical protein
MVFEGFDDQIVVRSNDREWGKPLSSLTLFCNVAVFELLQYAPSLAAMRRGKQREKPESPLLEEPLKSTFSWKLFRFDFSV